MDEPQQAWDPQQVEEAENNTLHSEHYMPYSVLTVGTELAVLSAESPVRKRIFSYGEFFKRMHIILLCGATGMGAVIEKNVGVYPTNSRTKVSRYLDALRLGKQMEGVDIVSAQDPFETALVSWWIARHYKAPLHVQVHTDFLAPEFAAHSLLNAIRVFIASFIVRRARRIRVVSHLVGESIVSKYGLKVPVSVLPIYIDTARFRAATAPVELRNRFSQFSHRLLVVSRFESEKNVSLALRAFEASAPKTACLILLGSGSERNQLQREVTKLSLDSRVFFEGHTDPAPYYTLADLVLVPSLYEGYGQVIVEALSAGKPVLSADVGIARESGAIITTHEQYIHALKDWFDTGPREGVLKNYPYASLDEYNQKYCADIAACMTTRK